MLTETSINTQSNSRTSRFPTWIHTKNFAPITEAEATTLKQQLFAEFINRLKTGHLAIDFRFTSKHVDLNSGKIKLVSEKDRAPVVIKELLEGDDLWEVLGPEDLSSSEGQVLTTMGLRATSPDRLCQTEHAL
jgi:hypothetical protein